MYKGTLKARTFYKTIPYTYRNWMSFLSLYSHGHDDIFQIYKQYINKLRCKFYYTAFFIFIHIWSELYTQENKKKLKEKYSFYHQHASIMREFFLYNFVISMHISSRPENGIVSFLFLFINFYLSLFYLNAIIFFVQWKPHIFRIMCACGYFKMRIIKSVLIVSNKTKYFLFNLILWRRTEEREKNNDCVIIFGYNL